MSRQKRSRIKLQPKAYKTLCLQVHERDSYKCKVPYCGRRNNLHAHHIVFRSHGGDDISSNLITLCHECHEALHQRFIVILPTVEGQPINADDKSTYKFLFIGGWMPRKTLKRHT